MLQKRRLFLIIGKWLAGIILFPVVLFLLLAIILYIPPVQNYVVERVARELSTSLGMDVGIGRVRLAFPLDLALHRLHAVERGDTLAAVRSLRLDVRLLPLLHGEADVDGFELYGTTLDTKSYISDTHIRGHIGRLAAAAHGIDWTKGRIRVDFAELADADGGAAAPAESAGFHKQLKTKFIEGSAGFMSLVALALVLGLAFCIERIIYLTLSEINAKRFMEDVGSRVEAGDIDGAKGLCRATRGPVASICYQGLVRIGESIDNIERSVVSYGSVQAANLEKGCSWITLFISMAPSLGFLGTVIGMVMAFDQIRLAGDINTTVVAAGMKVALITTIFGIIVALILQIFYNYILSKIEHITSQMEESSITLLDTIMRYKLTCNGHDGQK